MSKHEIELPDPFRQVDQQQAQIDQLNDRLSTIELHMAVVLQAVELIIHFENDRRKQH